MIRIADADGSGTVDFYEFVTLMAHKMADVKSESQMRTAFSLFDFSGDGYIQAEEMRRIMMNVGEPVTIDDVNGLIREVDRDGDGVVNYDEFCKVINDERGDPRLRAGVPSAAPLARPDSPAEQSKSKSRRRRLLGRR